LKARAVVFEDVGKVAFRDVDIPDPEPGDLVIRTRYSLISNGTESSFLRGERVGGDIASRPGDVLPFPQVTGYQKVGVVEHAPEGSGYTRGQWVFCALSRVGIPDRPLGGHVAVAVAPSDQVWALPEGLDPVEASGLVLTQVGYNCGTRAPAGPDGTAVVLGDGMVGQWAAQTLQYRGARVVLVGKHPYRYRRLELRPGDAVIDLSAVQDLEGAVHEACPRGIDILVDSVGANGTIEALFPRFNRNSHIVSAGFLGHEGRIDIQMLRLRETTLHAPSGWLRDRMTATLQRIADGTLRVGPLITHRMPAERAPEAFGMILEKREEFLGVLLEW